MSNKVDDKDYLYKQFKNFYRDILLPKLAPISFDADTATYDSTTSGLSATDVQDALDETIRTYRTGCNTITAAIEYQGETPSSNSPADLSQAILDIPVAMGSVKPAAFDTTLGYVNGNKWNWGGDTVSYSDVYPVQNGHTYALFLFSPPGTRFRALYTEQNILDPDIPHSIITGVSIINKTDPVAGDTKSFTVTLTEGYDTGYVIVTKDNAGTPNIRTALIEKILKPTS